MLSRTPEMEEERLPIVSLVIVADKNRAPANFVTIAKAHDDGSDADLWKDSFGFGIFNRTVRYIAVSRHIADTPPSGLEVLTDVAVISDKEALPSSFVCLDFTVDSKERALKKKYLCARFTPRTDALDAVTNIIVLSKSKKPPRGYTLAGDLDGMAICFRVSTIPENYGRLTHSKSELQQLSGIGGASIPGGIYPNIGSLAASNAQYRHSTSDLDRLEQCKLGGQQPVNAVFRGIDRVPFELSPLFATLAGPDKFANLPSIPDLNSLASKYAYNFRLEQEIATPRG